MAWLESIDERDARRVAQSAGRRARRKRATYAQDHLSQFAKQARAVAEPRLHEAADYLRHEGGRRAKAAAHQAGRASARRSEPIPSRRSSASSDWPCSRACCSAAAAPNSFLTAFVILSASICVRSDACFAPWPSPPSSQPSRSWAAARFRPFHAVSDRVHDARHVLRVQSLERGRHAGRRHRGDEPRARPEIPQHRLRRRRPEEPVRPRRPVEADEGGQEPRSRPSGRRARACRRSSSRACGTPSSSIPQGYSFPYTNMHYVLVAGGNAFYEKR